MEDNFKEEGANEKPSTCIKRKRRVGNRMIEFIGWCSKPLIEFLEALGQDTETKLCRHEVLGFISKYINEKGLVCAENKRNARCDEKLYALFRKKSVYRKRVYDLLEQHFTEYHDDSDSDFQDDSEEQDHKKKSSAVSKNISTCQMKNVLKPPRSCFAAVIPENIRLVYLKKSLVQELLKFPENFEGKVLGSFVRVKSNPNDIYQKNTFQLQQVTGVEKCSGDDGGGIKINLKVSNYFKHVPFSMLSDGNFTEEEVVDLQDRIKAGLLKSPTVNEMQLKAENLHSSITKHWIAEELSLLQKLIDRANEKGWRREMFEYLERRKTLQTPSEQEKLLQEIPRVIADEQEPESTVADASEKADGRDYSPKPIAGGDQHVDVMEQETKTPDLVCNGSNVKTREEDPQEKLEGVVGVPTDDGVEDEDAKHTENPFNSIWHYTDPQGVTQGPFTLYALNQWSKGNYFQPSFQVWRSGQTRYDGILLADVLHRTFAH